jgi:hypothetical protein
MAFKVVSRRLVATLVRLCINHVKPENGMLQGGACPPPKLSKQAFAQEVAVQRGRRLAEY